MNKPNTLYDWAKMSSHSILNDVDSEGKRLLLLFLKDYTEITGEKVNASCQNCLNNYITTYKNSYSMEAKNESQYILQREYQNIPLKFGSGILVNDKNITDEYGAILAERFKAKGTSLSIIFKQFPEELKTGENKGIEIVGDNDKKVKEDKPAKEVKPEVTKVEKAIEPAKEENGLTAEQMAQALNIEVKEPIVETGKDEVIDLEN